MSEKRFIIDEEGISDNQTDKWYCWKEEVVDLLNEQQATICKLQDLCGESDTENAKLRIENKRLQEKNEQLRKQVGELQKIIDLTSYQLKVQDRILKEVGE